MFPRLKSALVALWCAAWSLCSASAWAADPVVWVYPPANSLVTKSPVSLSGYLTGAPREALDAKVANGEGATVSAKHPLTVTQGRVFSGTVPLQPGRNRVLVAGAELPLYYEPDGKTNVPPEFRLPTVHPPAAAACSQCHSWADGELALKKRLPDLCLSCHKLGAESDRATLKKNKRSQSVTPDCLRCHSPHASLEPKLLKKAQGVCTECHPSLAGYGHDPKGAADGCGACHDAHASAWPALLKGEPLAGCTKCHPTVANPPKYPRSFHTPVSEGQCFECHLPHPGGRAKLAKADAPALCRTCHKDRNEGPHKGKLERCAVCHEPHQSSRPALLTEGAWGACLGCHPGQKPSSAGHVAVSEGCGACHDAHNIDRKNESRPLCERCHRREDPGFQSTHGGFSMASTRSCAICHDSHGGSGQRPSLLRGTVHYPLRNGGCAACHVDKSGKLDLRYEGSANCLRCHGQITGTSVVQEIDKVHKPVSQIDCTACHNPHVGARPKLLLEEPVTLCGWCHGTVLRGVSNLHGVFAQGGTCYTCHLPHISDFKPLLKRPQEELCVRCHQKSLPADPAEKELLHGAVQKGRCTGCHNPHGTNTPRLLRGASDVLCASCHKRVLTAAAPGEENPRRPPWKFLHGPVAAGTCTACHELRHGHTDGDTVFLKAKGSRVCGLCHETKPEHVRENFRSKMREVQNDCLSCHLPHGGDDPFLLRPSR